MNALTVNYPDPLHPGQRITATVCNRDDIETLCLIVQARQFRAELQAAKAQVTR